MATATEVLMAYGIPFCPRLGRGVTDPQVTCRHVTIPVGHRERPAGHGEHLVLDGALWDLDSGTELLENLGAAAMRTGLADRCGRREERVAACGLVAVARRRERDVAQLHPLIRARVGLRIDAVFSTTVLMSAASTGGFVTESGVLAHIP